MTQQKDTQITRLTFVPSLVDDFIDIVENREEIQDQLRADICFGGINKEIKEQVIDELIERLNELIPNIIIATHE